MIGPNDLDIIVPHLGGTKEMEFSLNTCLDSIVNTLPQKSEILVVRNGNLCQEHSEFGLSLPYQGQCKAVNHGISQTSRPWILVTNDDMIYPPGWWERMTEYWPEVESKTSIMCVSPVLVEPRPGAPTFEVYPCGGAGGDFDLGKFCDYVETKHKDEGRRVWRTGFNLPFLIRRELWETIGGYDEGYDPWGSNGDSDLEYKIRLAGIQPLQNTNWRVYHFSNTSGTFHPDNRAFWDKNWHYFISKWGFERIGGLPIWNCSFKIPLDLLKYKPDWMEKYGSAN